MSQAPSSSHSRTSSITQAQSAFNTTRQLPKTPHSQRYALATPTLDTGRHANNQVIKRDRTGELFKRISSSRLCYLMDGEDQADETVYKLGYGNQTASGTSHVVTTDQYESQLSARGDSSDQKETSNKKKSDPTFMLLDVRDKEEYEKCHIDGATHYPAIALKRDQISSTMYSHRSAGHLFVLYEDDGESKLAHEAGTLFVQKAFDHVHILNGGLQGFALKYPDRVSGTDVTAYLKAATALLPPPSRSSLGSTSSRGTSATSSAATSSRPSTRGQGQGQGQTSTNSSRPTTTRGQATSTSTSTSSSRPTSSRPKSSARTKTLDTDRGKPFR